MFLFSLSYHQLLHVPNPLLSQVENLHFYLGDNLLIPEEQVVVQNHQLLSYYHPQSEQLELVLPNIFDEQRSNHEGDN